jgi:phenylpropionate dioxygenase-like ring-hydroxylating dioxygenase large terminal subunit
MKRHDDPGEIVRHVPAGLEFGLRNYWYPVLQSRELSDMPVAMRYLGEDLVAWRDVAGEAHVFADYCPHRKVRLSLGKIVDDSLQCVFHGLRFGADGGCTFIPWEPDDSPVLGHVRATSYPTVEHEGLIFAYIGETDAFPAPSAQTELPPAFFDDAWVGYVMSEVWNANWLLALDGLDSYHLPILHWESSVMAFQGASNGTVPQSVENRRVDASTDRSALNGIVDGAGNRVDAGKRGREGLEFFELPTNVSLHIQGRPGAAPYDLYLWFVPIDAESTRVTRYVCRQVSTDDERAAWDRFFHQVTEPRTLRVSSEDKMVAEGQRSLTFARTGEHLFKPDGEIARRRIFVRDAFLAQRDGNRVAPTRANALHA